MQRLTTTERQMMAIMRLDADSPSSMSGGMLGEAKGDTGDSAGGGTSMLHALVEAKLALAEKEFEVMELQGKCRAKEVHIEALTDHLSAIRASMEAERRTISASTPPSLPRLRVKSRTPQSRLAPAGELVAAVGTAEKRSQSSSPVVQIFAHAGPA